jgi:hypothetical protein
MRVVVERASIRWTQQTHVAGELVFRLGRDGDALIAEWPGCLTLRVLGGIATYDIVPGAPQERIDKLKNGAVRAMLRQLDGQTSLHGSAVSTPAGAVVFVGKSGAGKSTFAASWVVGASVSAGCAALADDVAHIEVRNGAPYVLHSREPHFLDAAASRALGLDAAGMHGATQKRQHAVHTDAPVQRLAALVALEWGPQTSLGHLRGVAAYAALLPHVARLVVDDRAVLSAEMLRLEAMLSAVPVYLLQRPRDFEQLAVAQQLVLGQLKILRQS